MVRHFVLIATTILCGSARGQSTAASDPISSARPSFSDTPQIVPVRHLQIETGLSFYGRGRGSEEHSDFGEALLRYGVRPRLEFRVGLPNYDRLEGGTLEGFDNGSFAASYYLGKALGFDLGAIPSIVFPVGDRPFRYDGIGSSLSFNAQRGIGSGNTLGGTLMQVWARQGGQDAAQSTATVVAVHPFGRVLSGFAEYAGTFAKDEEPTQYAHFGLQFLTTKASAFDLHGGFGLSGGASHAFIGAGYSVRF